MRPLLLLLFAIVLAGCGAAAEQTGVPASSGPRSETVPAETVPDETVTTDFDAKLKPPRILLVSAAGKQDAVQGSFCVDYVDPASGQGGGVCGDAGLIHPDELSIANPGDPTIIALVGASVTEESSVVVRPLGCVSKEFRVFELTPAMSETHWDVNLEPGAYQIDVFTRFARTDGGTGDVSASLGLLVEAERTPEIVAVEDDLAVCPFPD